MVIFFLFQQVGVAFIGLAALGVLITDTFFSVVITQAFLRSIHQTLRLQKRTHSRRTRTQSAALKTIERTKWTTLAGVSVAVMSSSFLYVNLVLWALFPDTVRRSPWLNPFVFMTNVDSILNDVSMLLLSGTLASASFGNAKGKVYRISSASSGGRTPVTETIGLLQSRLEGTASTAIEIDAFIPPQEQPRCVELKKIAQLIEEDIFRGDNGSGARTMDDAVTDFLDNNFFFAVQAFFNECVEASRDLVPEMRAQYHGVRRGHLNIYQDTLGQIRQEPQFAELQRRSVKLVQDCKALNRPVQQSSETISGLYRSGEAVSQRYGALIETIASKTNATFHMVGLKSLVRTCEKIFLTVGARNGKPESVCDVVRGTIECRDFTTMINVQRLLCDLDADLSITGQTGGISEKVCISRCKNRFGEPTRGGWANVHRA
jgi:hypothetical protein